MSRNKRGPFGGLKNFFSSLSTDARKQSIFISVILSVLFVLFALYVSIHICWVQENDPWAEGDLFSAGFKHIAEAPFQMSPFPPKAILLTLGICLVAGAVVFFAYEEARLRRHEAKDKAAGDAKEMTRKELAQFNEEYTEPLGKPYMAGHKNMILANEIGITIEAQKPGLLKHPLNLNSLIIGGSGTGKSFRVIAPNLIQRYGSYVITDPSGGLYHKYGAFLERYGYRVKTFNTDDMKSSNHYNPFRYIHNDKDIEELVTMIITNTTSPEAGKGDQFWEKCETALFCSLIGYLYHYATPELQTFSGIMDMIRAGDVDENNSETESPLDRMFRKIEMSDPDGFTMKQYQTFRLGAGKTLKSILISAAVRLQAFDLDSVQELTNTDDIRLDEIADQPTALFVIVPTGEKTFNFLAGLLYSQLFKQLYRYCETSAKYSQCVLDSDGNVVKVFRAQNADDTARAREEAFSWLKLYDGARAVKDPRMTIRSEEYNDGGHNKSQTMDFYFIVSSEKTGSKVLGYRGTKHLADEHIAKMKKATVVTNRMRYNNGEACPVHVTLLLDEFSNTGKIPSFTEKISTIRKYEMSTVIILQSIKQIRNLYEKEWDVITGNCDSVIYLGGGLDAETTKWLNGTLGKKTVTVMNESYSKNGGSESFSSSGQDLFSMSRLRTMPTEKCLVLINGHNAYYGDMYHTPEHPDWGIVNSCPNYNYDPVRQSIIRQAFGEDDEMAGGLESSSSQQPNGTIPEEAPDDKAKREQKNKIAEQEAEDARIKELLSEEPGEKDKTVIERPGLPDQEEKEPEKEERGPQKEEPDQEERDNVVPETAPDTQPEDDGRPDASDMPSPDDIPPTDDSMGVGFDPSGDMDTYDPMSDLDDMMDAPHYGQATMGGGGRHGS